MVSRGKIGSNKMYGEYKMNAYIYAPKSDPYHREKWREPYPASELDRMKELIKQLMKIRLILFLQYHQV